MQKEVIILCQVAYFQRLEKTDGITKVELAKRTGINIGHITHIEKGERNPSHKALRLITNAIGLPYFILTSLYDKEITEDDKKTNMIDHLTYNKVLAIDSYSQFIECPASIPNASVAIKIQDDIMDPILEKGTYAFLELNVPLKNREIGLFKYNDNLLIRKFIIHKDEIILKAENKKYEDIILNKNSNFTIIGKIICQNQKNFDKFLKNT